jgi:hypothetical protein
MILRNGNHNFGQIYTTLRGKMALRRRNGNGGKIATALLRWAAESIDETESIVCVNE